MALKAADAFIACVAVLFAWFFLSEASKAYLVKLCHLLLLGVFKLMRQLVQNVIS